MKLKLIHRFVIAIFVLCNISFVVILYINIWNKEIIYQNEILDSLGITWFLSVISIAPTDPKLYGNNK